MLVVDRVELIFGYQPLDVWELEGDDAFRLEKDLHSSHEIVEVRHLRQDVVANDEVGSKAFGHHLKCQANAKEVDYGWHALLERDARNVGRRLYAQHGNSERQEMLQQVAVVAGELDRQAVGAETKAFCDRLAIGLRMGDPACREGREIGVFGEDGLGAHVLLELHQEAGVAD